MSALEPEPALGHGEPARLLAQARTLGIPWERLLSREIEAETTLRTCLADVGSDWPLWAALSALPFRPLESWRIRDRLDALSSEARSVGCDDSVRQLRAFFRHFSGRARSAASAPALARHLWFAYQRVLVLQKISRAARRSRSRGSLEARVASVRARTACSREDAAWAVLREDAPGKSHALDDAMRKAREEGFAIPFSTTETRAFRRLRSVARSAPHLVRRAPAPSVDAEEA